MISLCKLKIKCSPLLMDCGNKVETTIHWTDRLLLSAISFPVWTTKRCRRNSRQKSTGSTKRLSEEARKEGVAKWACKALSCMTGGICRVLLILRSANRPSRVNFRTLLWGGIKGDYPHTFLKVGAAYLRQPERYQVVEYLLALAATRQQWAHQCEEAFSIG